MDNGNLIVVVTEIRDWIRAAAYNPIKASLEAVLNDSKLRQAYQMLDDTVSTEQVRKECKMSPNAVVALAQKCIAMGLMEKRQKVVTGGYSI